MFNALPGDYASLGPRMRKTIQVRRRLPVCPNGRRARGPAARAGAFSARSAPARCKKPHPETLLLHVISASGPSATVRESSSIRPILELLKITPETELELSTDGERLVITPLRTPSARKAALEEAQRRVVRDHDETFRKLSK